MPTDLTSVRTARSEDAAAIARVHEQAWRHAYQGVIPHLPLAQMIARRGPGWWQNTLAKGMPALVIEFDGELAGYVTLGRSRMRGTPYGGELFELYVLPDYQGIGFGGRLFRAARAELEVRGIEGLCVWALVDNEMACAFYLHLGGRPISEGADTFGEAVLRKVAFAWS
ncbi:MAG: GNAT family N-acetyltransferase [Hyphomicrobiaceae bacterium]|nr:GNAT family N-acetyltransferase [Hyphomicrobiaceae bacterium]